MGRRRVRTRAWLGTAGLVAGLVAALGLAQLGRGVRTSGVIRAPRRVVLFAPNLTETAFALGHGKLVVGVTDFCVWPPQASSLPRVGGQLDPNLETLVALEPDLLVVQGEAPKLVRLARQRELRIGRLDMDGDVASILRGFVHLDSLLTGGDTEAGRALARRVAGELERLRGLPPLAVPPPRVLLVLGREPGRLREVFTLGGGTFLDELLSAAGGENLFASHPRRYFTVGLEMLLAEPPDLIVELRPGVSTDPSEVAAARELWRRAGLSRVGCSVLGFDGVMIPGPRIGETGQRLREAMAAALAPSP